MVSYSLVDSHSFQVDHFSGLALDLGQRLKAAEQRAKAEQDEARKLSRAHATLAERVDKETAGKQAAEAEAARLREEVTKGAASVLPVGDRPFSRPCVCVVASQVGRLRAEFEAAKRGARAAGGEARSRDVQLTRALEDAAKHKEQVRARTRGGGDMRRGKRLLVSNLRGMPRAGRRILFCYIGGVFFLLLLRRLRVWSCGGGGLSDSLRFLCTVLLRGR
jgi:hypothetical protein